MAYLLLLLMAHLCLLLQLCHPFNGDLLTWHPVTPAMSKPSYDCPDASQDVRKKKGSISTFFKASGSKPTKTAAGASPNKATADSKAANHSEQKAQTAAGGPKQQKAAGKGSISSFMKPVAASPAADENTDKDDLSEGEIVRSKWSQFCVCQVLSKCLLTACV